MTESEKQGIIERLMYNRLVISFIGNDQPDDITEDNIVSESMTVKQALCDSDKLTFGGCIASSFSIQLVNTDGRSFTPSELTGKEIYVKLTMTAPTGEYNYPSSALYPGRSLYPGEQYADHVFCLFSGYIAKAEPDKADQNTINITAYDRLARLYETDATEFLFNSLNDSQTESNEFGDILRGIMTAFNLSYDIGIYNDILSEQLNDTPVIVDDLALESKSWMNGGGNITYGELLKSLCELLGVFGYIEPTVSGGTFKMLYPFGTSSPEVYEFFEELSVDDSQNTDRTFDVIQIKNEVSSNGKKVDIFDSTPSSNAKYYDMSNNILAVDNNGTSYNNIYLLLNPDHQSFSRISGVIRNYRSLSATVDFRPWVPIGGKVQIKRKRTYPNGDYRYAGGVIEEDTFTTYILSRTITGIQALTDIIEVKE